MLKLMLVMVVKMFMGFVDVTLVDDTEVYLVSEQEQQMLEDMNYETIMEKEVYFGEEDEYYFDFIGIEADNGQEYFTLYYESDEFDFGISTDANGKVLYYIITRY